MQNARVLVRAFVHMCKGMCVRVCVHLDACVQTYPFVVILSIQNTNFILNTHKYAYIYTHTYFYTCEYIYTHIFYMHWHTCVMNTSMHAISRRMCSGQIPEDTLSQQRSNHLYPNFSRPHGPHDRTFQRGSWANKPS